MLTSDSESAVQEPSLCIIQSQGAFHGSERPHTLHREMNLPKGKQRELHGDQGRWRKHDFRPWQKLKGKANPLAGSQDIK